MTTYLRLVSWSKGSSYSGLSGKSLEHLAREGSRLTLCGRRIPDGREAGHTGSECRNCQRKAAAMGAKVLGV